MHQELIDKLLAFAKRNNLRFDYRLDHEQYFYYFRFTDDELRVCYTNKISRYILDTFVGSTVCFADGIIDDLKHVAPSLYRE